VTHLLLGPVNLMADMQADISHRRRPPGTWPLADMQQRNSRGPTPVMQVNNR